MFSPPKGGPHDVGSAWVVSRRVRLQPDGRSWGSAFRRTVVVGSGFSRPHHNRGVTAIPAEFRARITEIATDRVSGAATLLDRAIVILRDALAAGAPVVPIARAVCLAQPTMAPMWNAALEAVAARRNPERFERFAQRVARAASSLARFGADLLAGDETAPLHLVTLSNSRSVAAVLEAVHHRRPVRLSCTESRPALEGRALAAACSRLGMTVTLFGDAGIGHALASADAVLVGADAVAPSWFVNKSGTGMLAAAASARGVPVYVVASRDKFVTEDVAARLTVREGAATEIWGTPPAGVLVRNPYFEASSLNLVTAVISDVGVLGADLVADVCRSLHDEATLEALRDL